MCVTLSLQSPVKKRKMKVQGKREEMVLILVSFKSEVYLKYWHMFMIHDHCQVYYVIGLCIFRGGLICMLSSFGDCNQINHGALIDSGTNLINSAQNSQGMLRILPFNTFSLYMFISP